MTNKLTKIAVAIMMCLSTTFLIAQNPVPVGSGSYAEYPTPEAAVIDFYGNSYQTAIKDPAPYYVHERMYGQPIPTNDWTTDIIFSQYCGEVWAYPHMITADAQGANIVFPGAVYVDEWGSQISNEDVFLEVGGAGFAPGSAIAYDWNDIAFTMQSRESATEYINTTFGHGMPFVWAEYEGIVTPQINASAAPVVKDINGNALTFPTTTSVFTLTFGGVTYGVHLPAGTSVSQAGNTFSFAFSGTSEYAVISMLPAENMIATFDAVSRNVPRNTIFTYDYTPANGTVSTNFTLETENLDNGTTGGESILALMPHHWRNTTLNKSLIANAEYTTVMGTLKCAQGTSFQIDYTIPGMPSAMPAPTNLNQAQLDQLNQMIAARAAASGTFNGNTYAKGLGEESSLMLMAKELNHPGYETLKANLKAELIDWFTYTEGESTSRFFAMYPEMGALVGFPPGYGSQLMNDHNFHNGYFIAGAARLMLVDEQFKAQYGEITKKIAKSYANWLRYGVNDDDFLPFFRSFDPYTGHSWAGGLSGWEGPNQESTSESTNSWFALYTLGIALDDPEIINAGVMGFTLEGRATMEYWFDQYNDNYLPEYKEYTGIVFAGRLAFGTWFSGDRGWIFGIQCVPADGFYQYYMNDATSLSAKWDACLQDRADAGNYVSNDPYGNVADMGEYLGGYHLNYVAAYDPEYATQLLNDLMANEGGAWLSGTNATTLMYTANASVSYGLPADGYTTDDYSSGVFYNQTTGVFNYISSNYTNESKTVVVYNNGVPVGSFIAAPDDITAVTQLLPGIPPAVTINAPVNELQVEVGTDIPVEISASDLDGSVVNVELLANGISIGNDASAPYSFNLSGLSDGIYELVAEATDNDGLVKQSQTITVYVGNRPPQVLITSPFDEAIYFSQSDLTISADAIDPDGTVASVEFLVNGISQGVDATAPYSVAWNDIPVGDYTITAVATDNQGGTWNDDIIVHVMPVCVGAASNGDFTYTINSALPNPTITFIPSPAVMGGDYIISFAQVGSPDGMGGVGMTAQPDGTFTRTVTAAHNQTLYFSFVYALPGGGQRGSETFSVVIGSNCGGNIPPTANAGADQNITLPTNSVVLSGSASDADGTIASYSWSQVSGPSTASIAAPNNASTTASNLIAGTYMLELTVTDNEGDTGSDQVSIVVNPEVGINTPPTVNAGADQTITLPTNSVSLSGSATDADGDALTYTWSKVSGGAATIAASNASATSVTGLVEGTYVFRLSVSDGQATITDDIQVIVNPEVIDPGANIALNKPATASSIENAGTVAANVNDGNLGTRWSSQFSDPQWIQIDLQDTYAITDVTLNWETAASASYEIQISSDAVTWNTIYSTTSGDGGIDVLTGLSGSGQYIRMYSSARTTGWGNSLWEFEVYGTLDDGTPQNQCPVLDPIANLTITEGECATITASATDADGDALTYTINGVTGQTNTICGLVVGTHVIDVSVSDGECADATQVTITVEPEPNVCPVIDPIASQTITEGECATITASATDADGDALTYTINGVAGQTNTICGLVVGTHVIDVSVSDGECADATQVTITVEPEPNVCPVLDVIADQTITEGECATITASATDADGDALTYTINGVAGQTNTICGLSVGTHVIDVSVSDGECTDAAQVTITVNPEPTGCIVSAASGDFEAEVTNDGDNPSLTFIPGYTGVGNNIVILYYKVGNTGTFPGYIVQPNVPYQINASAGDHVYFYYTYSVPEGGERNSSASKNDFIVGQCSSTLKDDEAISLVSTEMDVNIYPNPANEKLFIDLNGNNYSELTLLNLTGMKVLNQMVTEQETVSVSLNGLESGTYFIKLDGASGSTTELFIIE